MNKAFLTQFPGRVSLAKVLPSASYLPQLQPIPWVDNDGSLTSKMVWHVFLQTDCVRSGSCHLPAEPVLNSCPTSAMGGAKRPFAE